MENIKILVSYDSKKKILKNEILCPIQIGRDLSREIFDNMIGDNTGDNISCYSPILMCVFFIWFYVLIVILFSNTFIFFGYRAIIIIFGNVIKWY